MEFNNTSVMFDGNIFSRHLKMNISDMYIACREKIKYISAMFIKVIGESDVKALTESTNAKSTDKIKKRTYMEASRVIDDYGNAILRLSYTYLHNMADAEDILQDTLIKYMQSHTEFDSNEHEKAWLLRVAANLSKNRIAYNSVRESDEIAEELIAEQREDLSFVWDAVKELPVVYREVVHLYYYEGFSTRDIAEILHMNESTVRSNMKRGRERLRQILKEEYDFE